MLPSWEGSFALSTMEVQGNLCRISDTTGRLSDPRLQVLQKQRFRSGDLSRPPMWRLSNIFTQTRNFSATRQEKVHVRTGGHRRRRIGVVRATRKPDVRPSEQHKKGSQAMAEDLAKKRIPSFSRRTRPRRALCTLTAEGSLQRLCWAMLSASPW